MVPERVPALAGQVASPMLAAAREATAAAAMIAGRRLRLEIRGNTRVALLRG
jgi:hypothetical protein